MDCATCELLDLPTELLVQVFLCLPWNSVLLCSSVRNFLTQFFSTHDALAIGVQSIPRSHIYQRGASIPYRTRDRRLSGRFLPLPYTRI